MSVTHNNPLHFKSTVSKWTSELKLKNLSTDRGPAQSMNNSLPAAGNQLYSLTFSALERGSWWCLKWFSKPQHFRLNLQIKGKFSELRSACLKQWPSFPTWMAQNFSARRTRNTQRFPPEVTSVTSKRIHGIGSQVLFLAGVCLPSQFCRAQVRLAKSRENQLTTRH